MIDPQDADIGRAVAYIGSRRHGGQIEVGVITSFNEHVVFVRYGDDRHSKATKRMDLEWR